MCSVVSLFHTSAPICPDRLPIRAWGRRSGPPLLRALCLPGPAGPRPGRAVLTVLPPPCTLCAHRSFRSLRVTDHSAAGPGPSATQPRRPSRAPRPLHSASFSSDSHLCPPPPHPTPTRRIALPDLPGTRPGADHTAPRLTGSPGRISKSSPASRRAGRCPAGLGLPGTALQRSRGQALARSLTRDWWLAPAGASPPLSPFFLPSAQTHHTPRRPHA